LLIWAKSAAAEYQSPCPGGVFFIPHGLMLICHARETIIVGFHCLEDRIPLGEKKVNEVDPAF
jgi:hypothetical protein